MKPFNDRNKQLVDAWNALIDSIRKWDKTDKLNLYDCDCTDEWGNPTLIRIDQANDKKGEAIL